MIFFDEIIVLLLNGVAREKVQSMLRDLTDQKELKMHQRKNMKGLSEKKEVREIVVRQSKRDL